MALGSTIMVYMEIKSSWWMSMLVDGHVYKGLRVYPSSKHRSVSHEACVTLPPSKSPAVLEIEAVQPGTVGRVGLMWLQN